MSMLDAPRTCEICDHYQKVERYSDWTCEQCGQEYEYDEADRIALTEEQMDLLRRAYQEKQSANPAPTTG